MKNLPRPLILAAILTLIYLLALAFNLTPWLRGPDEWRWAYALPGTLERLWLPALVLIIYALLAYGLHRQQLPLTRRLKILAIALAAIMTPVLQLTLLYMDHPDVLSPLFYRTVSESAGGYFNVGASVTDTNDFLTHFAERMPNYPIHPQRHPPGLPLLFAWGRQFFDQQPALAESVNTILRPYQCQNLPLMNLPNSAIASATLQMIVPLLLGLMVLPLYKFGREMYDEDTALRAVLVWPLIPSLALWATRWDQVYALFTILALLFFHLALSRHQLSWFFLSGLVFSVSMFFSFSNAVTAGVLGIYALIWLIAHAPRPGFKWLMAGAGLFALSSLIGIGVGLINHVDAIAIWRTALSFHLELDRSYLTWLFFQPYDFFVFMGLPLFVWWAARTVTAIREARSRVKPIDVLALTFICALILLSISNTSRGETARVWSFLLPLPLLIGLYRFPRRPVAFMSLIGFISLQVFISNIFLRTVGTGLSDPPAAPPAIEVSSQPIVAEWQDGPVLQSIDLPPSASAGQALSIQTRWTTAQQIDRPYTLFIHVVDAQGQIVTQYDGLAFANTWPTTCWRSNESFADTYGLTLPGPLSAGAYRVELGFYWLATGERLALSQPGGDVLSVGSIEVR